MPKLHHRKHLKRHARLKVWTTVLLLLCIGCLSLLIYLNIHRSDKSDSTENTIQSQKTVIKVEPKAHVDKDLQSELSSWASSQSSQFSISVYELSGELRTATYQSDVAMIPASTYKVYVAYAVLHFIEQGKYSLNTPTRTGQSINICLTKMIVDSDNDCGRALGFLLGWETINDLVHAQGFLGTELNNYVAGSDDPVGNKYTTANDETNLLKGLHEGKLLSQSNTDLLFSLMKRQAWRERIAAGLPSDITVVSKPGWLSGVQNDMGIVYGPKSTYIIVILSDSNDSSPLSQLSKIVYDYLNS